jgi:hypothetical protein
MRNKEGNTVIRIDENRPSARDDDFQERYRGGDDVIRAFESNWKRWQLLATNRVGERVAGGGQRQLLNRAHSPQSTSLDSTHLQYLCQCPRVCLATGRHERPV